MNFRQTFFVCLLLCWVSSAVQAQTRYPSTKYQGFSQSERCADWATSPPTVPDLSPDSDQYGSMSPDSWGEPSIRDSSPVEAPADNNPDSNSDVPGTSKLQSNSPFRSSGFPRPVKSNETARSVVVDQSNDKWASGANSNLSRYPLAGGVAPHLPSRSNSREMKLENTRTKPSHRSYGDAAETYSNEIPYYRPDLGHRSESQTFRQGIPDDYGQQFDFENKKKEYPPMSEILATGRYFGSASVLYSRAAFQSNTAIATQGAGFGESIPFDFDYEAAPQFRFGFESKYGPGFELEYVQYDETSNIASFTSNGSVTGTSSTWMLGPNRWSELTASNAGERLDTSHTIDVESVGVSFFKEIQFKISRLNGMFGFHYASIAQSMNSVLTSGGSEIGRLSSQSNLNALGPKFALEYYRPVGHTKFELYTSVGGSLLFGRRDQFVSNTASGEFDRIGADEFVTMMNFLSGIQYKKMTAENRAIYARMGYTYQTWLGGGTAVDPQGDFGLRGFSFGVGYNR